jgi:hypothetical protein
MVGDMLSGPNMTVGAVRAFLADMPDDAEILDWRVVMVKTTLQRCFVPGAPVRPAVVFDTTPAIRAAFAELAARYGDE